MPQKVVGDNQPVENIMRFRRIDNTFLAVAESDEEALKVEILLKALAEGDAVEPKPPPSESPVDPADILMYATADLPFAKQKGYTLQCINTYTPAEKIPESGIHGSRLPDGSTLRFGKVEQRGRKGLIFVLAPTDPDTSGSKRNELAASNVDPNGAYWCALGLFVPSWGVVPDKDTAVVGVQLHSGGSAGLSPAVKINARQGKTLNFEARHSLSNPAGKSTSKSSRSPEFPIVFGRWMDIVMKFKYGIPDGGYLQTWVDGIQQWDFKGPLGYKQKSKPYFKFGFYNWSGFRTVRSLLLRNPVAVLDPTGSKYTSEQIRCLIEQIPS